MKFSSHKFSPPFESVVVAGTSIIAHAERKFI